jgi:hypothetical protein
MNRESPMPTPTETPLGAMPTVIEDATIISRSPSMLTAEVNGEIVMMSIERGRYFGLDDIGSEVWKYIEPPCSFGQLIDRLSTDFDADRATIAGDVRALLRQMLAEDVVRLA